MATTVSHPRATLLDKMMYNAVTALAGCEYYVVTARFSHLFVPTKNLQKLYVKLCVGIGLLIIRS